MSRFTEIIEKLEDVYNDSIIEKNETNAKHALIAAECESAFRELASLYGIAKKELSEAHRRIGQLNNVCNRDDAYWMIDEDGDIVCSYCGNLAYTMDGNQEQSEYCPCCGRIMKIRTKEELELDECPHCGGIARYENHEANCRYDIFTTPTVLIVCENCGCRTKGTNYDRDAKADEPNSLEKAMQEEKRRWNTTFAE